jgi:hypothetical protein
MPPCQKSSGRFGVFAMSLIVSIGALGHVEAADVWSLACTTSTTRAGHAVATVIENNLVRCVPDLSFGMPGKP